MEKNSKETQEEVDRKREFHRIVKRITNMEKRDEAGPSSSNTQQPPDKEKELEMQQRDEMKTMSSNSDSTIAVPATNYKDISERPVWDTSRRERQAKYSMMTNGT